MAQYPPCGVFNSTTPSPLTHVGDPEKEENTRFNTTGWPQWIWGSWIRVGLVGLSTKDVVEKLIDVPKTRLLVEEPDIKELELKGAEGRNGVKGCEVI